ncbi:MAG: hypothetical protein HY815_32220 [Candidatus Riflebacteria bacterium]|nr:hypothetical protein [Candidatus Riflebacteria bacterium]
MDRVISCINEIRVVVKSWTTSDSLPGPPHAKAPGQVVLANGGRPETRAPSRDIDA